MLQDLALHRGAFHYRCTYFDLTVVVCEQDFVETYGRIFFALKTVIFFGTVGSGMVLGGVAADSAA